MALIHDDVFDNGLNYINTNAEKVYILTADPSLTWSNIASYACGNATPTFTGPAAGDTNGRKLTLDAVTAGTVTSNGVQATHFAVTDDSATKILYSGALASAQYVYTANGWTAAAADIELNQPA